VFCNLIFPSPKKKSPFDGSPAFLFKNIDIATNPAFFSVDQPELITKGSKASTMNGVLASTKLYFPGPDENVFPDPRFGDVCLQLFPCANEIGICNLQLYVLLILIKFLTTKRGRRIFLASENMRTSSFFSSLLIPR
jgi:hypothetical protein